MHLLSNLSIRIKIIVLSLLGIAGMALVSGVNGYVDLQRRADQAVADISQETVRMALEREAVEMKVLAGETGTLVDAQKTLTNNIFQGLTRIKETSADSGIRAQAEKSLADEQASAKFFGTLVENVETINRGKAEIIQTLKELSARLGESIDTINAEEVELSMEGDNLDPTKGSLRMELKDYNSIWDKRLLNIQELFILNDPEAYSTRRNALQDQGSLKGNNISTLVKVLNIPEISGNWDGVGAALDTIERLETKVFERWTENRTLSLKMKAAAQTFKADVLEIVSMTGARIEKSAGMAQKMSIGTTVVGIGVLIIFSLVIIRSIVRPLKSTIAMFKDIAQGDGDLTKRLETGGRDEISEMAAWFNAFLENLNGIICQVTLNAATLNASSGELSTISTQMSGEAAETADSANSLAAAAKEMSANMASVAAAMEESSGNLNTVAAGSEEMNATVGEIARNTENARTISEGAVTQVETATSQMNQLGQAAKDIGKVVETITDISEQVNLLSLNATIEAARAGEAGKGFAVVANEIKDLAEQTAEASGDIKDKIVSIQNSADESLQGMGTIASVIQETNDIVATIAAAVEEQSASSGEIAQNISQASAGIEDVNQNVNHSSDVANNISRDIASVNAAAGRLAQGSSRVEDSSAALAGLATDLGELVGRFKTK